MVTVSIILVTQTQVSIEWVAKRMLKDVNGCLQNKLHQECINYQQDQDELSQECESCQQDHQIDQR